MATCGGPETPKIGGCRADRLYAPRYCAVGGKNDHAMSLWFSWFAIVMILPLLLTACVRIPCPGPPGYADPNWCEHRSGGGGNG
jgi:hypothetical protein